MGKPFYLTCLLRNLCAGQEANSYNWDMEKQTGFKLGKEYIKAVHCHPAYLTYMQSTSCKIPGWMKHKLESRLPGETPNNLRYADDTTLMAESEEEQKSLLIKVREEMKKLA